VPASSNKVALRAAERRNREALRAAGRLWGGSKAGSGGRTGSSKEERADGGDALEEELKGGHGTYSGQRHGESRRKQRLPQPTATAPAVDSTLLPYSYSALHLLRASAPTPYSLPPQIGLRSPLISPATRLTS
jgi:hypothetical protein